MAFLVFIGFLYPPPAWKVFSLRPEISPKDFLSVVVVYACFFSVKRLLDLGALSRIIISLVTLLAS